MQTKKKWEKISAQLIALVLMFFIVQSVYGSSQNMDLLWVCNKGCDYTDLNEAIKHINKNGTIYIAQEKLATCAIVNKPVFIIGELVAGNKRPHLTGKVCQGKGVLVVQSDAVIIENLEISDVNIPARNGACIRIDPTAGDVLIKNIYCHDSQNGILAKLKKTTLIIENSIFERNGFDNGQSHGLYLDSKGEITLSKVKILSTKGAGQSLKITAPIMYIFDSAILALEGKNSRAIDNFGGGVLIIKNSVLQQGPYSENTDMLGIALEQKRLLPGPHSVTLENNWLIFDNSQASKFTLFGDNNIGKMFRANKKGPYLLKENKIVGMQSINLEGVEMQNNWIFNSRKEAGLPVYNGSLSSFPVD